VGASLDLKFLLKKFHCLTSGLFDWKPIKEESLFDEAISEKQAKSIESYCIFVLLPV